MSLLGITSLIKLHLREVFSLHFLFVEKMKCSAWCPWLVGLDGRGVGVATIPGESPSLVGSHCLVGHSSTTTSVTQCHRPQNANTNTNTNISTNTNKQTRIKINKPNTRSKVNINSENALKPEWQCKIQYMGKAVNCDCPEMTKQAPCQAKQPSDNEVQYKIQKY